MRMLKNILLLAVLFASSTIQPMKRKNDFTDYGPNKRPKIEVPFDGSECNLSDDFLNEVCSNPLVAENPEPVLEKCNQAPQWIFVDETEAIVKEYSEIGHLVDESFDEEISDDTINTRDNKYILESNQTLASNFLQTNLQNYPYQNYPYSHYGGVSYGALTPQHVIINQNPIIIINNSVPQQPSQHVGTMHDQQAINHADVIKLYWGDAKKNEWFWLPSKILSRWEKLNNFRNKNSLQHILWISNNKRIVSVIRDCLIEIDKHSTDHEFSQEKFNDWFTQRCAYINAKDVNTICTLAKKIDIKEVKNYKGPANQLGKLFPCKHCDYIFDIPSKCELHMQTHRQEKLYLCKKCRFDSNYKQDIKRHLKKFHNISHENSDDFFIKNLDVQKQ